MLTHIYICLYTCAHLHISIYVYIFTYIYLYEYVYIYTHTHICIYMNIYVNKQTRGWRNGSADKRTGYSYRGPGFDFQHPQASRNHLWLQLYPEDPTPLSSEDTCTCGHTPACGHTYPHIIKTDK